MASGDDNTTMMTDSTPSQSDEREGLTAFEICMLTFLAISYMLIVILFALLFLQRKGRTLRRYSRKIMRRTEHSEDNNIGQHVPMKKTPQVVLLGAPKSEEHSKTTAVDMPHGMAAANITNPNYMSNVTSSSHLKESRDSRRFSIISERRYSQSAMDVLPPPSVQKNFVKVDAEIPEDNYSLVAGRREGDNESEHNYSLISSEDVNNVIGHLSSDSERDDSEHNYSCISNHSLSSAHSPLPDKKKKKRRDRVPAEYEEFYSVPADSDISESEGEGDSHRTIKNTSPLECYDNFQNNEAVRIQSSPSHTPSPPLVPKRARKRSATSSDIFGLTSDDIYQHPSPVLPAVVPSKDKMRKTEGASKPVPKPRVPRNAIKSENYL